jgi:hypothetical protein
MRETQLASAQTLTDPEQLADAAAAAWHDVWIALSPVIGGAGVAALFRRTLFLRTAEYPWLADVSDPTSAGEFDSLRCAVLQQRPADAIAANAALLQSLAQVLGTLVGASLTNRLLQPVWEKHGHTTQDRSTQ